MTDRSITGQLRAAGRGLTLKELAGPDFHTEGLRAIMERLNTLMALGQVRRDLADRYHLASPGAAPTDRPVLRLPPAPVARPVTARPPHRRSPQPKASTAPPRPQQVREATAGSAPRYRPGRPRKGEVRPPKP